MIILLIIIKHSKYMIRLDSKKFVKIRSYKYIISDKYFKRSNLGLDLV